jgi:tripartite-type tricarboxylate transporter receptor subunit TctC
VTLTLTLTLNGQHPGDNMKRTFVTWLGASLFFCAAAQAQPYPAQPIRLVVPFTPGGGTDAVSRLIADKLMKTQPGWTVVIDNKPGAGGNIGMDAVAKSRPDGLTLAMGQTSTLAINPALYPKLPFDPLKDFVPVALVAAQPMVLVVSSASPLKTVAALVAAAKARPGALTQALAGTGTVGHLAGEMFGKAAGFTFTNVPYKGAAPALQDLIGGQTDFMFSTPQAVLGLIKGGKLHVLAVTAPKRLPVLPDAPTLDESGYKGFEASDWKAIVAPAGTPAVIARQINAAVEKALGSPATIGQLMAEGSAPMKGTPEQVAAYIKSEHQRWGAAVRAAGATAN